MKLNREEKCVRDNVALLSMVNERHKNSRKVTQKFTNDDFSNDNAANGVEYRIFPTFNFELTSYI